MPISCHFRDCNGRESDSYKRRYNKCPLRYLYLNSLIRRRRLQPADSRVMFCSVSRCGLSVGLSVCFTKWSDLFPVKTKMFHNDPSISEVETSKIEIEAPKCRNRFCRYSAAISENGLFTSSKDENVAMLGQVYHLCLAVQIFAYYSYSYQKLSYR